MVEGTRFTLRVLGGLIAGHDETCSPPVRFSTKKVGALLAYVALSPSQSASREQLAALLWGDRADHQARQNLRQALVFLRKDVHPADIVETDASTVRLKPGGVWVDALALEGLAAADDVRDLQRAASLYRGEFLAGFGVREEPFEDWVREQRRHFEATGSDLIAKYAVAADARGNGAEAMAAADRLLGIDPLREDWHRLALELHARYRGRNEALARATAFAQLLKRELALEPEAETRELVERIRRDAFAPAVPARPEPLRVVEAPSSPPAEKAPSPPPQYFNAFKAFKQPDWAALTAWARSNAGVAASIAGLAIVGAALWLAVAPSRVPLQTVSMLSAPVKSRPIATDANTARFEKGTIAIVVLPLTSNDSAEPGKTQTGALADIMTDELTTTLSSVGGIRVISRETARTFSGQRIDAASVGTELGVAYLLEGSASVRGDRVRVNVGLVDAKRGVRVWSRRFERAGEERHAILDEVVSSLCRDLQVEVARIEGERASRAVDVHAAIQQGWSKLYAAGTLGRGALLEAETLFKGALDRDPANTQAQLGLAGFHVNMAVQLFAPDPAAHLDSAEALLAGLLDRRPHMAPAHSFLGLSYFARGRLQEAKLSFERAIELNPSHAPSYAQLGRVLLRLGQIDEGRDHIHYAMRLSPRDPHLAYWLGFAGAAELELLNFEKAAAYFGQGLALNPGQPRMVLGMVSAQALLGRLNDARDRLAALQREQPHLSREKLIARVGEGRHNPQFRRGLLLALGENALTTARKP